MATILPGSPPAFDRNDVGGTVKAMCNYTRSMQENIDFLLGQFKKDVSALQLTTDAAEKSVSDLRGVVSNLETKYDQLAARVTALEQKIG